MPHSATESSSSRAFLATLADRADLCVKCGLCLPHCPTYLETENEADSPRGRIALMAALASEQIGTTPAMQSHLDGCLSCRACEAVCPANVPYGGMMDDARAKMANDVPRRTRFDALMRAALVPRTRRSALLWLLWLVQSLGLVWLGRKLFGWNRLGRLASLLPPLTTAAAHSVSAEGQSRGRVALFTGCVSDLAERQALRDGATVLAALGFDVEVPASQTCCGALAAHSGQRAEAAEMEARNADAFGGDYVAIVGTASGCTAQLMETGAGLSPVENIDAFIARQAWPDTLQWTTASETIAFHTPCTLRNVLKTPGAASDLLRRLPGVNVIEIAGNTRCCGAAGSYFVTQPEMADALLAPKIESIRAGRPDAVCTSNVGCAMHIGGGLRRVGDNTPVEHAVSVMARRLKNP